MEPYKEISELFKMSIALMNTCGDAIALLEEYHKELVVQHVDPARFQELEDKYEKVIKRWKGVKSE